jgi:hypothetical protein
MLLLATACSPVQMSTPTPGSAVVAGWYVQDGTRATLQPCAAGRLVVTNGDELRRRAADFGLHDDLPVYVRVSGVRVGDEFRLAGVEQFGSPVPIRNCPMSGTTTQR